MSTKRALAFETFNLVVMNFGGMLIGLVATILITRALGPEIRGVYAWVFTIYGIGAQIAMLVPYNTVRQLGTAQAESRWPALMGTFSGLLLLGWMLTLPLLGWALAQPLGGQYTLMLLLAWLGMPLAALANCMAALIHLRRRPADILIPMLIPRLFIAGAVAAAWAIRQLSLTLAVLINPLASLLSVGVNTAWLGLSPFKWRFDKTLARQAAHFVGATWAASLMAFMAPKIVLLILPKYVGLAALGYYSIAATLLDVALMLPNAVSAVLISHFTRGESNAANRRHTLLALLVLMAGAGVFGAITAPYLLPLIFGPPFIATVAPFRILLLVLLIQAPLTVYTSQLVARTKATGLLIPPLSALLATAVGAFWLIPAQGINGAAMAVTAGYAIQLLTTLPFCRKSPA